VSKTRVKGLQGREGVWRYLPPCVNNPPTWRTDRRTYRLRQQRPRYAMRRTGKCVFSKLCLSRSLVLL